MRRLPNFLIIGAVKCGTTSLHQCLGAHPEVFMHPAKELRFFAGGRNWQRGPDWYEAQFAAAGDARIVGETSPAYTLHPVRAGVPERISRFVPDARLVYLIRHPIRRIESHYRHRLAAGSEWRSPEDALRADRRYIDASRYGHQLRQYLRHFRPEQILTLRLEGLAADPRAALRRVCRFLDIDEARTGELPQTNVTAERAVAPRVVRHLARFGATRKHAKWAARRLARSPVGHFTPKADAPEFALSEGQREDLARIFENDKAILSEIVGEPFDDWTFEADQSGKQAEACLGVQPEPA